MKKKFLSFILAICLIMPFALVLTACGGKDPDHTHSWSSTYSHNSTQHWKTCSGCDDLDEKNDHTYNVDTCSVCGYVNSNLTPASLQSMDTYFSGVKAEYLKDSFVGADNQTTTFEELLDTQIDVLAQDLIYRLTYIYGAQNESNNNRTTENGVKAFEYSYDGAVAKSKAENMITNVTESFDSVTEVNLNNIEDAIKEFQKSLTITDADNYLNSTTELKIVGAIEGYNLEIVEVRAPKFAFDKNESNAWQMSCESSTYENMLASYKNEIKLGLAKILGASQTATEYSVNLLNEIKTLGYSANHKQAITNYILNNVIGSNQVAIDNSYYNMWLNDYDGLINNDTLTVVYATTTIDEKAPLLYKGYSIVVPAIVEQALANTFEDTNVSLYPKMSRTAYESTTTTTGFATEKEYQTITLMPKADAVTTKLVVKLTGVGNSVGQTIALDYDVVINGTIYSGTKNVTLTSIEQEVEIDLSAITNGSTLGAYNGTTTSHTSGNAFNNNDFDVQGNLANNDGNNYIKLDFNNTNNYSFIVTFGGMYNK